MNRRHLTANWCRTCDNFGDRLTVPLLHQAGFHVVWQPARRAQLIGVGSILCNNTGGDRVPHGYRGYILGSGMMFDLPGPDLRKAKVLAVRGPLTAAACKLSPMHTRFGDFGLLAPELFEVEPRGSGTLVVPHNVDKKLRREFKDATFVSLRGNPADVVAQFMGADRVVASALHAIILADALGIERRWEPSDKVYGGGFKFRDHAAALGQPIVPGEWQTAPAARVAELQQGLREAHAELTRAARTDIRQR